MTRAKGEKDKHGETDREIIFALCYNVMRGNVSGLSKTQLSKIVENATGKDRDGIRKRLDSLTGVKSSLNSILIVMPPENGIKKLKIEINGLLDLAKFSIFMEKSPELLEYLDPFVWGNLRKYITEVVDILQLWKPDDPNYGLPKDICRKFEKENIVDFDPSLYPETGPSYLKLMGKRFQIFNSVGYPSLEHCVEDSLSELGRSRFFHLILDFNEWALNEGEREDNISEWVKIILPPETIGGNKTGVTKVEFNIPRNLNIIQIGDEKNEKIELEYKWFLDIWRKLWNRAKNGELLVHTYFYPNDLPVIIEDRTPENVSEALGIPLQYVKYDESTNNQYISYNLPGDLMPKIDDGYYPQILFRNGKYILHRAGHLGNSEDSSESDEQTLKRDDNYQNNRKNYRDNYRDIQQWLKQWEYQKKDDD
jgi:hypothetical protein